MLRLYVNMSQERRQAMLWLVLPKTTTWPICTKPIVSGYRPTRCICVRRRVALSRQAIPCSAPFAKLLSIYVVTLQQKV